MSGRSAKVAVAWSLAAAAALSAAACESDGGGGPLAPTCALGPGDLLITEVMARPSTGTPRVEWFEVYNPTDRRLALTGVTLEAGTVSRPKTHRIPAALDPGLEPGAYLAIGSGTLGDGITGYAWTQMELADAGAFLTVRCGDTVVDRVTYGHDADGNPAPGPGDPELAVSWQFSARAIPSGGPADPSINEAPEQWCLASPDDRYGPRNDTGTPGAPNRECVLPGECRDGDGYRVAAAPAPGDLVITEVYANPPGSDDKAKEWFEVRALRDVDLNGLVAFHDNGNTRAAKGTVDSLDCVRLASGAYGILAGSGDAASNGGLPPVLYAFPEGLSLYNNLSGEATVAGLALSLEAPDGTVVATAVHPEAPGDVKQPDGSSLPASSELSAAFADDPDGAGDPAHWCTASATGLFQGLGTPGAPNEACP